MTTYTRLLVIGSVQKASMVVPSQEPLASHVATIADAVAEPHGLARLALVDAVGRQVDTSLSLGELGLVDGTQVRLVRSADVPAPPEVTDVTDAVAYERDTGSRAWTQTHRVAAAASVSGIAAFAGLNAVRADAAWAPITAWTLFVIAAVVAGALGRAPVRAIATGLATGAAIAVSPLIAQWFIAPWAGAPSALLVTVVAATALVWVTLGLGMGWGGRSPGAAAGSLVGAVLALGIVVPLLLAADAVLTFAVVGAVALVGLGMVPTVALAVSGLTRLDDAADSGTRPTRATVALGVEAAYEVMTWTVYALAITVGMATAVLLATGELWSQLVATSFVLVTLLRTRVMALARQAWPLWAAATLGTLAGLWMAGDTTMIVIAAAVGAVVALVCGVAAPQEHTRIKWRRWGDTLEALSAIAVVPCVIGMFGVYEHMLGVFA